MTQTTGDPPCPCYVDGLVDGALWGSGGAALLILIFAFAMAFLRGEFRGR